MNTLYPAGTQQWSWTIRSKSKKPKISPLSAISTTPGPVNIVACLEPNANVFKRQRGMTVVNPDFRNMCMNVGTWCGSVCHYTSRVKMPTCDANHIIGPTWQQRYKKACTPLDETIYTPLSVPLNPFAHANLRREGDPFMLNTENETLIILGNGINATWTGNDTTTCSWHWEEEETNQSASAFNYNTLDQYDIFAIVCTVLFDSMAILTALPLLPSSKKNVHHGMYAKRMMNFQHGLHDLKLMELLETGNVRSLVFVTPRVVEPDFKQQMESTCSTMLQLAEWLKSAGMVWQIKLIVCVVDEDRRMSAFNEPCIDPATNQVYFRTQLLQMVEECSRDPDCKWFPGSCPTIRKPPPGGHYRSYSRKVNEFVRMEFHYLRRGWRIERKRNVLERILGFGEQNALRVGDHVVYNNGPGEEHGLGFITKHSLFGPVTIARERYFGDSDNQHDPDEEIQLPEDRVNKMIVGGGKGAALAVAYHFLRASIGKDLFPDNPDDRGTAGWT